MVAFILQHHHGRTQGAVLPDLGHLDMAPVAQHCLVEQPGFLSLVHQHGVGAPAALTGRDDEFRHKGRIFQNTPLLPLSDADGEITVGDEQLRKQLSGIHFTLPPFLKYFTRTARAWRSLPAMPRSHTRRYFFSCSSRYSFGSSAAIRRA